MSRQSLQIVAVVVGIVMLAPWAPVSARPLGGTPQPPGILASLWGNLVSLWSAAGCELDPSGKCVSNHGSLAPAHPGTGRGRLVTARGAAGCEIDPDGRCAHSSGMGIGSAGGPTAVGILIGPGSR
jgi:hypothetical protein